MNTKRISHKFVCTKDGSVLKMTEDDAKDLVMRANHNPKGVAPHITYSAIQYGAYYTIMCTER